MKEQFPAFEMSEDFHGSFRPGTSSGVNREGGSTASSPRAGSIDSATERETVEKYQYNRALTPVAWKTERTLRVVDPESPAFSDRFPEEENDPRTSVSSDIPHRQTMPVKPSALKVPESSRPRARSLTGFLRPKSSGTDAGSSSSPQSPGRNLVASFKDLILKGPKKAQGSFEVERTGPMGNASFGAPSSTTIAPNSASRRNSQEEE